jgi:hypothetical protein
LDDAFYPFFILDPFLVMVRVLSSQMVGFSSINDIVLDALIACFSRFQRARWYSAES